MSGGPIPVVGQDSQGVALAALALAMAAPLGWARRHPWPVLAVLLTETAAAVATRLGVAQICPLVPAADLLVGVVAAARSPRAGHAAAALTFAVQVTVVQVNLFRDGGWARVLAPGYLGLTACLAFAVLFAWQTGASVRERRAYDEALRMQAADRAVTADRLRIARELHDMVAHSIGVIAIQAGAGSRVIGSAPEQAQHSLEAIEVVSRETLGGLRHMLDLLRQPEPGREPAPEYAPFTSLDDLDRLVATAAEAGVRLEVRRRGEQRPLPTAVDRSAFRIIQESVTNVVRHAATGRCRATVEYRPHELWIEVADDGRCRTDTATDPSGYGICGMRERVALLDGSFTAGPRPEGGFRVAARLPLPRPCDSEMTAP
ncbi:sensor histidine kinase [Streptomyces sp. NBC_01465]|uniref:sensor histidine kinase n=1 Tax=Streptomyces sp. NBC_01465 TaxID=2903878 RepID=UPI002E32F72D|nr:histidine kinase [Streptomyces sp. NBC_01465]